MGVVKGIVDAFGLESWPVVAEGALEMGEVARGLLGQGYVGGREGLSGGLHNKIILLGGQAHYC